MLFDVTVRGVLGEGRHFCGDAEKSQLHIRILLLKTHRAPFTKAELWRRSAPSKKILRLNSELYPRPVT